MQTQVIPDYGGQSQYQPQMVPTDQAFLVAQPGQAVAEPPVLDQAEDFVLMDVVGGGCAAQVGASGVVTSAARSVSVHHPTKPMVAYTAGCMIIVYDLLNDSKVNLTGHKHDVYALAFTPNGQNLLSVDFNREAELHGQVFEGELPEPSSTMCLWELHKGPAL